MPFTDSYFEFPRISISNYLTRAIEVMPGMQPFTRHVALHLSVQRCLNGPRRYDMPLENWPGLDDLTSPLNEQFRPAITHYKEHLSYAMTTSSYLRLRPTIIRLPQGLPREEYIRLGEALDANMG
jgi:hypothetical protein